MRNMEVNSLQKGGKIFIIIIIFSLLLLPKILEIVYSFYISLNIEKLTY